MLRRCLLDARTAIAPDLRHGRDAAIAAHLAAWLERYLPARPAARATDAIGGAAAAAPAGAAPAAGAIGGTRAAHEDGDPGPRAASFLLGVYWPIRGEPDLRPLYDRLAAAGIGLALPVVTAPDQPLSFALWQRGAALEQDRWGIAAPRAIVSVDPDALLIPCVGFNATRHRLGYGGGFYDRTLAARKPRPLAIGIAATQARCDFAAAAHDLPMDVVITETGCEAGATQPWSPPPG